MNKKVKAVKRTGKDILAPVGSGMVLNQKLWVKKHMTDTAPTMSEFLNEAQAELENLFA